MSHSGVGWKYPEFRGVYAGVRWIRLDTTNGPIIVAPDDPALFVQVLSPRYPEGEGPPNPNSTRPSRPSTQPSLGLTRYARAQLPDDLKWIFEVEYEESKHRCQAPG